MPILNTDIKPGVCAIFNIQVLVDDPDVTHPENHPNDNRHLVCIDTDNHNSEWIQITGKHKLGRLQILKEWRESGSEIWFEKGQYINDGDSIYSGPNHSFVVASQPDQLNGSRAVINDIGICAIKKYKLDRKNK